jgi:hypothetical protein
VCQRQTKLVAGMPLICLTKPTGLNRLVSFLLVDSSITGQAFAAGSDDAHPLDSLKTRMNCWRPSTAILNAWKSCWQSYCGQDDAGPNKATAEEQIA